MPVWNRAAYVGAAVQSVLAQTVTDLELVVVDGGSTDGTLAVLAQLAATDSRVRVATAPRGQTPQLNHALELATSERIAFLDSDDLWRPHALERLRAALDHRGPDVGWAYGRHRFFHDGSDPHDEAGWLPFEPGYQDGRVHGALLGGNFMARISVLIRRPALEAVGARFASDVGMATDWDLFLRLARRFEVVHVPEVVALARLHGGNMSHDVVGHHRSFVRILTAELARSSPSEVARLRIDRALARQQLGLARHLLEAGQLPEARDSMRAARRDGGRRVRVAAEVLLTLSRAPGGPALFRRLHPALLSLAGRVPWRPQRAPN